MKISGAIVQMIYTGYLYHNWTRVMAIRTHSFRAQAAVVALAMFFAFYIAAHDTLIARPYALSHQQAAPAHQISLMQPAIIYSHDCPLEHGGVTPTGFVTFTLLFEQILLDGIITRDSVHTSWSSYPPVLRGPPAIS